MRTTLNMLRVMRCFASDPKRNHWVYAMAKQTNIPVQTLHDILRNMAAAGWLAAEREPVNALAPRAPRMLYRITELGIAETKKAMRSLRS